MFVQNGKIVVGLVLLTIQKSIFEIYTVCMLFPFCELDLM
jgi:hypothetical protein